MKSALLILPLALIGSAQTRLGQCGGPFAMAANPGLMEPGMASPHAVSQATKSARASRSAGLTAKPENSRPKRPPVLSQIQLRRPLRFPAGSCWCGTAGANALTSATLSQELPMIGGLSGNFRLDHVLIQETTRFSSDIVSSLVVSAGRANGGEELIAEFALMSQIAPQNFAYEIPEPPVLAGTYNLVLKFAGSSPLAIAGLSNFASGSVNWEVCGHQVP